MKKEYVLSPAINIARIPVNGAVGGIFAFGTMAILLIGLPEVRYLFPAAVLLGSGVALALRLFRREAPATTSILLPGKQG